MNKDVNLKQKTISSLSSSYFMQFAHQAISIISQVILVRILSPDDFGLFALAFIVLNIAKVVTQLGLGQYIIREEKINYGALFALEAIWGCCIFVILQIITPYLAKYNSSLPVVSRVLSFAIIPYSLSIVPISYAQKELELKKMVIPNLLFSLSFAVGAILLSLKNIGIWSLVYAHLMSEITLAYLAWRAVGHLIVINFKFVIKEITRLVFGAKYFFALSLFTMLIGNIDKILLGKLVPLKDLGYYTVALTVSLYFVNMIEPALNNVFYPLFSKIKNDISKTKEFYASTTIILHWLKIPFYIFLAFNAEIVIKIVLGLKWMQASQLFRLLCILAIMNPCSTFGYQIVMAHGKEKIQLYLGIAHSILFFIIGWSCIMRLGLIGIIYAQFFLYPISFIFLYFVNKIARNVFAVFIRLLPIYVICILGLALIKTVFQTEIAAFVASFIYIMLFCVIYYRIKITRIIKDKFGDIKIFRILKLA